MVDNTVTITNNRTGQQADFDIIDPTVGLSSIDVRQLSSKLGLFTYDPGFHATASCKSDITYIDGDAGILRYRGYPIEQLADHSNYMEVSYLLMYGELPDDSQYQNFIGSIKNHTIVHESLMQFITGFHNDAHPMAIMVGVVGALSAFYHDSLDITNPEHRELSAHRLLAKMPTIAALSFRHANRYPPIYLRNDLGYIEIFLHMMFCYPLESYQFILFAARVREFLFIL